MLLCAILVQPATGRASHAHLLIRQKSIAIEEGPRGADRAVARLPKRSSGFLGESLQNMKQSSKNDVIRAVPGPLYPPERELEPAWGLARRTTCKLFILLKSTATNLHVWPWPLHGRPLCRDPAKNLAPRSDENSPSLHPSPPLTILAFASNTLSGHPVQAYTLCATLYSLAHITLLLLVLPASLHHCCCCCRSF